MKSQEFCYWLQGLFELGGPTQLDEKQTKLIKQHLNMVFIHEIDPSYPVEQQQALNEAHATPTGSTVPVVIGEIKPVQTQWPYRPEDGHGNTLFRC